MQRRGRTKTLQAYLYAKESHSAPEHARALLPPLMHTQFSMTGTLQRGMSCIACRSAPEVQYATRLLTSLSAASIARCFPSRNSLLPQVHVDAQAFWSVVEG